jgi:hypothetical protein
LRWGGGRQVRIRYGPGSAGGGSVLATYTYILLFVHVVICLADRGLFAHWGFRIDATPLHFIETPKEMLASFSTLEMIIAFVFGPLYYLIWCYIATLFIRKVKWPIGWNFRTFLVQFFLLPVLFLLMRGACSTNP